MMTKLKNLVKDILGINYPYNLLQNQLKHFAKQINKGVNNSEFLEIDIVLLTLNRLNDTKRTLDSLFNTSVKFRLIVIDQASNDGTRNFLKDFASLHKNVFLKFLEKNIGVSGGRAYSTEFLKNKYTAFIDNDMVFMPGYFENLYSTIDQNLEIAGVSAMVVNPDKKIEINSPSFKIDKNDIVFFDNDRGKYYWEVSTKNVICNWLPMGASIWRTEILKKFSIDSSLLGAHEDNEYCYNLWKKGYRFSNCPSSVVLHISARFVPGTMQDTNYTQGRFNVDKIRNGAAIFYKKHNLFFFFGDKPGFIKYLEFESEDNYKNFLLKQSH